MRRRENLERSLRRAEEATAPLATASDKDITSYFHWFTSHGEAHARASLLPDEEPAK